MQVAERLSDTERYARCLATSKRVRWDIDTDVIRGRRFGAGQKFLPDGLSRIDQIPDLGNSDRLFLSRIQGRTYANMFGLVERFINAKVLEVSRDYVMADQTALEALVGFSAEELKHQELFRRVERLVADEMPEGYSFGARPDDVADAVLTASTWAVLALTLHIELFTQTHYRQSIEPGDDLSPLFKDIFLFHWKEESQHAIMDELELRRADAGLTDDQRETAVDEFIALVGAVDGILRTQAEADTRYFAMHCERSLEETTFAAVQQGMLDAYRWQYIFSGAEHPHFGAVLAELTTAAQLARIQNALASLR